MIYAEEMLALKLFEHAMVYSGHLEESERYAGLCVDAARNIFASLVARREADKKEEARKFEERKEAEMARRAANRSKRKAEREERKKKEMETTCYLLYKKYRYLSYPICLIIVSLRDVDALKTDIIGNSSNLMQLGFYRISHKDADMLLSKHGDPKNDGHSKLLVCRSCDDYLGYISECTSAECIDLSDIKLKGCAIL